MKRIISIIFAVLISFGVLNLQMIECFATQIDSNAVGASTGTTGDCKWNLDDLGVLTISGNGSMKNYNDLYLPTPWKYKKSEIKKVVIEQGVENIGSNSFSDCKNLTEVSIADSVIKIGAESFKGCSNLSKIDLPNSIKNIEHKSFYACTSLKRITIPNSVISLGDEAFYGCESLISISLSNSMTKIESSLFYGCRSLENITIPNSINSIEYKAFRDCTCLKNITIPNNVTYIGFDAFLSCICLESIIIPDSVVSIGSDAFDNTAYYNNEKNWYNDVLYIDHHLIKANSNLSDIYTIKDGTLTIAGDAFNHCENIKRIQVPNSVKTIGEEAFGWCYSLETINIPDGLINIEEGAFRDCHSLKSINLSNGTTNLVWTFCNCWNLTNVTLPSSLQVIGDNAFDGCSGLTELIIPNNVTKIGDSAFAASGLKSLSIPNSVTQIDMDAFYNCNQLQKIIIPKNVTDIGRKVFYNCYQLTIYGYKNSYAEEYATANDIPFVAIDEGEDYSNRSFSLTGNQFYQLNKEGNLNVSYQSAVDGQVLNELKNIKWTNSNPDIATVSGLDTGVADTGNNKVSVMATVKALNVGITTIEGTSPDGRKASFTINVEPEIKTNSGKTINNETDLAVFTVALNKPNKSYLQSFMNGIKASYEFKDGLASFDVSSPTVSIGDDGLSATFNYHLSPQWGGNITFVAVSSNGQIVDCLVNSGIDKYPEAPWTFHNEWRFKNRAIDDLSLTNEDYNALILGQSEKSIAAIKEYTKSLGKVGICFGMSFSAINFKKEIIPLDYLGNGIEYLYDANFNSISQSIIGYYHILQKDDDIIELGKTWLNYSNQKKLSKISRMKPGLLVFDWDNYSHAVVIYGEENGNWTRNGHKYNKRIETYDCNYPENLDQSIREESYLYYNSETYEWEIPNYDGASSYATGYLRYAFDDDEHLNLHNLRLQRQGIKNIVRLKDDETYTIVASNGQRFIIGGNTDLNNNICYTYKDTGYNLDGGFSFINVELNPQYTYEIIPENGKLEDFSVLNNGYCSTVDTILLSSIEISDKNVIANDIKGEYEISITSDNSTSKYSTYNLNGYDNKKISLDLIDSGLSIEGDDLSDITITGKNQTDDESESISIADGEDSVQIINQNKTFDLSGNMVNGDVNLDGIVNIIDATTVQQYLAEFLDLSDIQKKVADTDGDGTITITDATVIQQYLAEYIDHFNQPSAIKLNTNAVTLNVSDTHSLLPTISPSDVTNKSVTWTSSDNDIATISNGTVTAKSPGTAKITAKTYNGKTAKCTVTVKQIEPSSVSLNKNTLSLNEGDSYQLTATVSPSNATNKSITWETNNPEVATVDSNGRVTAKKSGKTNIIAETTNGKRAECSITVNDSYINIYTEDDLYNIRRNLNGKFRLMTNIDTYGSPFSFGSQSQPFTGELDGNGFSITIKYDQGYAGSSMMTRGIFSYTENAYIHDLTVKGELVSSLSYYNGGMTVYCAGISACSKNSIFENCVNNATSNAVVSNPSGYTGSGYAYSGGIVAWSKSDRIIGCTNNGNVSAYGGTELRTDAIAGGIVAVSDGTEITRCNNNGYVYSQSATSSDQYWALAYSGGIIGSNYSCSLNNCNHNGTVEAICQPSVETKYQSWAAAGGIIAYGGSSVSYAGCTSNYNCKANGSNGALLANGKFYAR